jgi:hypothetical protein
VVIAFSRPPRLGIERQGRGGLEKARQPFRLVRGGAARHQAAQVRSEGDHHAGAVALEVEGMDAAGRHDDDRRRAQRDPLRIQAHGDPAALHVEQLVEVAMAVRTDLPVEQRAARGNGLDVGGVRIRRPGRLAVQEVSRYPAPAARGRRGCRAGDHARKVHVSGGCVHAGRRSGP